MTDLRGRGGESEVGGDGERLRHAAQPLGRLRLRRRHGVAGAEVVYKGGPAGGRRRRRPGAASGERVGPRFAFVRTAESACLLARLALI